MSKTRTFVGAVVLSLLAGEAYAGWNMGYPWGRTHNGNCYMVNANAQGSGGSWTLKATQPGSNGKKYNCGAIYSTTKVYVNSSHQGGASAWISAPTAYGTWPAFWLTTEGAWTGEVDIAEWKGSSTVWQNVYDGGWETRTQSSNNVTYKAHMAAKNSTDAYVYLYINGNWTATFTGSNFIGKNFWLIANLQMEGSSGSPGPSYAQMSLSGISQW